MFRRFAWLLLVLSIGAISDSRVRAADGNRLTYLQEPLNPYYPHVDLPRLTTPQWCGKEGVRAVVVLAIDDMRESAKYEQFLRPILDRLKQIDGRAPVSIMTNQVDPHDPQLASWLAEGLSLETHTTGHPCPLLADNDLAKARRTYEDCVDLLASVPGNRPGAFRMPCCDSRNTPSPRFWTEIFNQQTAKGNYLELDSSVFTVFTSADRTLPNDLVTDDAGRPRFRKYLPFPSFVNTIENYPYPYMIGKKCWEFPCTVPSDWEAQNLHQPFNPETVADMKAALDAVVLKQGVMNIVFHPWGWIRAEQMVEFIEYSQEKYGEQVLFLNFREALDRLNANVLGGRSLRENPETDVFLLDVDNDALQDVVIVEKDIAITRHWDAKQQQWRETRQAWPYTLERFTLHLSDYVASCLALSPASGFHRLQWSNRGWNELMLLWKDEQVPDKWRAILKQPGGLDDFQVRDIDRDGRAEVLLCKDGMSLVLTMSADGSELRALPWALPSDVALSRRNGADAGLRFVDVDEDGFDDCVFSDIRRYSVHLFESMATGWSRKSLDVLRADTNNNGAVTIPPFVLPDGSNHGVWAHSGHFWLQNESTNRLDDGVARVSFRELLGPMYEEPNPKWGGWGRPRSPESARATMHVPAGYRVELVASEPLVDDPVAFDWGPDNRLWVVEMRDYPLGIDGQGKPGGRVKVLEDVNGDGRYDRATTFLDDLPFPTGIKVWRKGVIVSGAPEILYAEDTDGDQVADRRETLYRGFSKSNPQHRVNGLRLGLDGWLYLANGESNAEIVSEKTGKSVFVRNMDVKIEPDSGDIDVLTGSAQCLRSRDDWGNWFGNNNSEPLWQFVLEDRYLRRNKEARITARNKIVPAEPGASPVYPASATVERFNDFDRANRFTSACSPMIYRDRMLEDPHATYYFVCEPVHNLVHRATMTPDGVSYVGHRVPAEDRAEFFASDDNWCRPSMVRTGPDGAVWIADMYRLVIEHPEWIPMSWQQRLDLRAGEGMGRIYRVCPPGNAVEEGGKRPIPDFDKANTEELVELLRSPNGTVRDMAHALLLWQHDPKAVTLLRQVVRDRPTTTMTVHAMFLLHGWGALEVEDLIPILAHGDEHLVVNAMRLSESWLEQGGEAAQRLGNAMIQRQGLSPSVDLQLACSLGYWNDKKAAQVLAELAGAHAGDHFVRDAVKSSLTSQNVAEVVRLAGMWNERQHNGSAPGDATEALVDLLQQGIRLGDAACR
ncbi:MAG: polysaccharide deacetylase family protein, partial [Planctomycetales bacterium]|nr:polysaccharide deacetylase family protein [Planctomycetales bacterium]